MVRRFHQDVAQVGDREQAAGTQAAEKIRAYVDIRARHQAESDAFRVEHGLKFCGRLPDRGAAIMVQAGKDMRCACDDLDALIHRRFRHFQRHGQVAGPVVQPRQHVAMKVNHSPLTIGGETCRAQCYHALVLKHVPGMILAKNRPFCGHKVTAGSESPRSLVKNAQKLSVTGRTCIIRLLREVYVRLWGLLLAVCLGRLGQEDRGRAMRLLRTLVLGLVSAALLASTCSAATIKPVRGQVSVNRGQGFEPVNNEAHAKVGDLVMVSPDGAALVAYPDGCKVDVHPGAVMTIAPLSPCASGSYAQDQTKNYMMPTVFGGVVLGVAGFTGYEISQSSSTTTSSTPSTPASP